MTPQKTLIIICLLSILAASTAHAAIIWPANNLWHPLTSGGGFLPDPDNDFTGANGLPYLDIVGNSSYAAGYWYLGDNGTGDVNDDTLMFRMRMDGNNQSAAYQFSFDTNATANSVDWVLQLDNVVDNDVELVSTTVSGPTYGDVSLSVVNSWQGSLAEYARLFVPATDGSAFGGTPDYFVDVAIPWTAWQTATGLTQQDPWRAQLSTATQHNVINKDYPQGWSNTNLVSQGFGDPVTPNPVPEPGTLALLGLSLVGVAIKRRRQVK